MSSGSKVAGLVFVYFAGFFPDSLSSLLFSLNSFLSTNISFSYSESPGSVTLTIAKILLFVAKNSLLLILSFGKKSVSPDSTTLIFCIICRTITSICLSLIFTPCKRYTSCISFTKYSLALCAPRIFKISIGEVEPSQSCVPAIILSCS